MRVRKTRGPIGDTWWSQRFVTALEQAVGRGRLQRGRAYARSGQVRSLRLSAGQVEAVVQGSMPRPYRVVIRVPPLSPEDWQKVERVLASRVAYIATLLDGRMPDDIEEAFSQARVPLFIPSRGLQTACTCPDTTRPCKHAAAVCYVLAEQFDKDPFRIIALRGRTRERLLAELRALRPAPTGMLPGPRLGSGSTVDFWNGDPPAFEIAIDRSPSGPPDAVLRDVDPAVSKILGADALAVLAEAYEAIVADARKRLAGLDSGDEASATPA